MPLIIHLYSIPHFFGEVFVVHKDGTNPVNEDLKRMTQLVQFEGPRVRDRRSVYEWVDWFEIAEDLPPFLNLVATWRWVDQGWGNKKGALRVLLKRDGQEVAQSNIGGICEHNERNETYEITDSEVIYSYQRGDTLQFQYTVGGGGGHSLNVDDFRVTLTPRRTQAPKSANKVV